MVAPKLQLGLLIWKQNVFLLRAFSTQNTMSHHGRDQVNSVLTLYRGLSDFSSSPITVRKMTEAVSHGAGGHHVRNNLLNDFSKPFGSMEVNWNSYCYLCIYSQITLLCMKSG